MKFTQKFLKIFLKPMSLKRSLTFSLKEEMIKKLTDFFGFLYVVMLKFPIN